MSEHVVRCAICNDPADMRLAIRGIEGWEHRRMQGGAHGMTLKQFLDVYAHPSCIVAEGERRRVANKRNFDPRTRRRPIEPKRRGEPCWYVNEGCSLGPVDDHSASMWRRVRGFDPPREDGGRNSIPVRDVIPGAAHDQCIRRLATKIAPGQGTLL